MASAATPKQTPDVHLHAQFCPDWFILLSLSGGNPKFYHTFNFAILWWRHLAA